MLTIARRRPSHAARGCVLPPLADLITRFLEDRIAKGMSPHTIRGYRDKLAAFAVWSGDRPLTRDTLRSYLADLQQRSLTPHTVHSYFRDVRTLCSWLNEEHLLSEDIARKLTPRLPKRCAASYTAEQIQRLLQVCDMRDRALILVLLDTGLRRAELLSLQRRDITITGRFSVIGKGNKERSGELSPYALYALWDYLGTRSDNHPCLWYGDQGPLTEHGLYERVKVLCVRANVRRSVRKLIHGFRATFAKNYIRRGGDLESLRQLLGHADLKMSAHYAELAQVDVDARKRQVNPLAAMVPDAAS